MARSLRYLMYVSRTGLSACLTGELERSHRDLRSKKGDRFHNSRRCNNVTSTRIMLWLHGTMQRLRIACSEAFSSLSASCSDVLMRDPTRRPGNCRPIDLSTVYQVKARSQTSWGVIHKKKNLLKNLLKNFLRFITLANWRNWSSWDMSENQNSVSISFSIIFSISFFSCESHPRTVPFSVELHCHY